MKSCCVYVNDPEHDFDKALAVEAARVAQESTRKGFPMRAAMRYARGDAKVQWKQIHDDQQTEPRPDLVIVIPINQDAVYEILCEIVKTHEGVTCVFLHQSLTKLLASERAQYKTRLFSVSADQVEIGRFQARQLVALLADAKGDILYVQGREDSYGTRARMMGLIEELKKTPGVKLNGYRIFGDWSAGSVRPAVEGWIKVGGHLKWIHAAAAQSDDMALALADLIKEKGFKITVTGVDGLDRGRRAVDEGRLAATVIQPLGVGHAMGVFRDLLTGALQPGALPDTGNIVLQPESYPPLAALKATAARLRAAM